MQVCRKFNTKLISTRHVAPREIQKRNVLNIFETKPNNALDVRVKVQGEVGAVVGEARVKSM